MCPVMLTLGGKSKCSKMRKWTNRDHDCHLTLKGLHSDWSICDRVTNDVNSWRKEQMFKKMRKWTNRDPDYHLTVKGLHSDWSTCVQ